MPEEDDVEGGAAAALIIGLFSCYFAWEYPVQCLQFLGFLCAIKYLFFRR